MATAALVDKGNIELGRRVIVALTLEGIPIVVGLWAFASQSEEWQLTIATSLVDEVGPLAAYGRVQKAIQKHYVENEFPRRQIFLRSPKDRVLRSLQHESRALGREDYRLVNAPIAGSFVEDAYLYSGFIDIAEMQKENGRGRGKYRVVYAHSGSGGAARAKTVKTLEELTGFLVDDVRIKPVDVAHAISHLREYGWADIPNVLLKNSDLKRLDLV